MYDTARNYRTKRDREKVENWRDRSGIDLTPRNDIEKAINDNHKELEEYIKNRAKVPVGRAIDIYLQARSYRHDVWIEFLNYNKTQTHYNFNDIPVELFHERNYKGTSIFIPVPDEIKKLTPDILVRDELTGTIILGDVTCTNFIRDASKRKHLKYQPVEEFYTKLGVRVKHIDFIVDINLSNLPTQIANLENVGLIRVAQGSKDRAVHYFRISNTDMKNVMSFVEDSVAFDRLLKKADKDVISEYHKMEIPNDVCIDELETWEPKKTEYEIAMEIREKAEELGEKYFDNDMSVVIEKLDKLKENNKVGEHIEPKSTLKCVFNTMDIEKTADHDLIVSYLFDVVANSDDMVAEYIRKLLPTSKQINMMKELKTIDKMTKEDKAKMKELGVYGTYQYNIDRSPTDNNIVSWTHEKLMLGKKIKNGKEAPKSIDPDLYQECYEDMNIMMNILGEKSDKPPIFDDSWNVATNAEAMNSEEIMNAYSYVKSTNGAQLSQSMSMLYQRLCHLKTSLSVRDNIFVPPNGSFICVIPKNHAPVTSTKCDVPMIFIARCKNNSNNLRKFLLANEYEHRVTTEDYTYIVSKLCRLNIDRMANWDQSNYKIVANSSYLSSLNSKVDKNRIIGILTTMCLDLHQKTSELLDLLKYVAFMPFANLTRLSALVEDKFDIMIKTKLDAWTLKFIENLMIELSDIEKLNAYKPPLHIHNGIPLHDSFGMNLELPSIFQMDVRHSKPEDYIEEISMIYIIRGKQLYGSQFMDKSITQTAQWELDYREEVNKYGDWVVNGKGKGKFPFDSKFAFSSDAIVYASAAHRRKVVINKPKAMNKLSNQGYNEYMHYNCSLRGCVKEQEDRKNPSDLHTTSMEACLREYKKEGFADEKCTNNALAYKFLKSGKRMEFSMSEKEQRGGGRPIATPTILTKAALTLVEKPESVIGSQCDNNIIVPGKNKMKEICETYKTFITNSSIQKFDYVYQITEDQTKFSEMDNPRKFIPYIDMNENMDPNVRRLQKTIVKKLLTREHLVKRMPAAITETGLSQTLNAQGNGVVTQIGWPQGMCNFISTSIHMIADEWITDMYNLAYPENQVVTKGLVHSDDSWVAIGCNSDEDFERFLKFRIIAKRCFCLKMNEKKLWASKYLGELVSNYNINGNVHMSVAKIISNCFNNLNYINWVLDVHSQISTLQQAYRNGANMPTLILLSTLLKTQIMQSYRVNGLQKELLHLIPIEIGGYPNASAFEMATTGALCHYQNLITEMKKNPGSKPSLITLRCLKLSMNKMKEQSEDSLNNALRRMRLLSGLFDNTTDANGDEDYSEIRLPYRGDVFTCIKYLMPQSKKVKMTVNMIRTLEFTSDQMELIITRPKKLSDALGHLKEQTSTMIYTLAAEKYTQSARRLAISQSMQATGRVVKIGGVAPITMNDLLLILSEAKHVLPATIEQLQIAFTDSNPVPIIANSVVYNSTCEHGTSDKRKIINRLPEVDDNFNTLVKLKDVLLYIIDSKTKSNYYELYKERTEPLQLVEQQSELILKRFAQYFNCYHTKIACGLIMKLSMEMTKTRLWMQPYLNQESLTSFMEDLYGKTLNQTHNYIVRSATQHGMIKTYESDLVNTIYSIEVLNKLYTDKFVLEKIEDKDVEQIMEEIDYTKLSQDDMLKAAMSQLNRTGDTTLMKIYDKNKKFSKTFLKAQNFANGKYEGKFSALIKFGQAVAIVSGEPGNVTLEVNSFSHLSDLLMAMMIFVNDSFPNDRYNNPTQWSQSDFWNNRFCIGDMFLASYSMSLTMFSQTKGTSNLPVFRNERLKFDQADVDISDAVFELDETMRVAYKVVNGKKIRIGNIRQGLSCPLERKTLCKENDMEGFDVNELIHTKAIINMTLRKPFATPRNVIKKLIEGNRNVRDRSIVHMYRNILNKFVKDIKPSDIEEIPDEVHTIEFSTPGISAIAYMDHQERTSPEDLRSIQTEFVLTEDETRTGSLVTYTSVLRFLCRCLHPRETKVDMFPFVKTLLDDRYIIKKIKEDIQDEDIEETLDELEGVLEKDASISTLSYIIGFGLDIVETWKDVDMKKIITSKVEDIKFVNEKLYKRIIKDMNKAIFDEEMEDDKNELLSLLSKR